MGLTNFPDGISAGADGNEVAPYATATGARFAAGTAIVTGGSIDVASGLDTVTFAVGCPYGVLDTAGTAGSFVTVTAAGGSGGTVTLRAFDFQGTASVSAGTAAWWAIGT